MRELIFLTLLILFFLYLTLSLLLGEKGLLRYVKLRGETKNLSSEVASLEDQNRRLEEHMQTLSENPSLIEELAREQGFMREGELIFRFEDGER